MQSGQNKHKVLLLIVLLNVACVVFSQNPSDQLGEQNQFGINLFIELVKQSSDSNLFFSPYGITNAMAMAFVGAENKTKEQIRLALKFSNNKEGVSLQIQQLNQALENQNGSNSLKIANAAWLQKNYNFNTDYLEFVRQYFNAKASEVSFGSKKEISKCCKEINAWVSKSTNKEIVSIINEDDLNTNTRLVLTNALYFNGIWKNKFDTKANQQLTFYNLDGSEIKHPFMHQKASYKVQYNKEKVFVELPYAKNEYSFCIVMPQQNYHDFEKGLSLKQLQAIAESSETRTVSLWLPKFSEHSSVELKTALMQLGIQDAFNSSAEFTSITGLTDLFIDEVYHKAHFIINEDGAVATASSAIVMNRKSANLTQKVVLNKPFFYYIKENKTGTILFLGRKVSFN